MGAGRPPSGAGLRKVRSVTDAVLPTTVPEANAALAGRLLADQFPQWADLPLAPVEPAGSDHAISRL
ncbi:MAG: hypothetical protein QOF98_3128, partial [Streptomyces sp.]|nr:hypothetical protein [Streptomyces sp.]